MPKIVPKRIGIDCRLSGSTHAGIGRYIEELIIRLPLLDSTKQWVYFFFEQKQIDEYLDRVGTKPATVKLVIAPIKHYSLKEQQQLPKIFEREDLDLLHIPHFNTPFFYRGRIVVTIHDLLWHEFIGLQATTLQAHVYFLKYLAYRLITYFSVKKAEVIFVPAQTIKKVVEKYYPSAANKILVTSEGFAEEFSEALTKKTITKTILYVGSLYPHKNLKVVLEALKNLPDYKLKIVGSRNVFQDQTKMMVEDLNIKKQVEFTGYLNDKDLRSLMAESLALVQPSLSEGFGLTGIEAMAAGLPVIASRIAIFEEIYQDGALFFDPKDPNDFISSLRNLESGDRNSIIAHGKEIAHQYSWDKMSQKTLAAYNSI